MSILIDKAITDPGVSYLVLDTRSAQVIASRWIHVQRPIPAGSLVKPLIALAYGETHTGHFPEYTCSGQCWLRRGHGQLNLEKALANSCNSYFRELWKGVDPAALVQVCARLGVPLPSGNSWKVSPLDLARSFGQLDGPVLAGLRQAAQSGTAKAVGGNALAKTGTTECTHVPRQAGDGLAIALFPAEAPRYTVLVRKDGATGANAAIVAGRIRTLVLP